MTIRPATIADLPTIQSFAEKSGFPYPSADDPLLECCLVVESEGQVLMACAAKKLVELYLWSGDAPPLVKLQALALLHDGMAKELRIKGYSEAQMFLPPEIEPKFGRRMVKSFGWCKNWLSYYLRF